MSKNTDHAYYKDYDGLQYVKHQILSKYLAAWFPILTTYQRRVVYIDTHAGRGRHHTGAIGSPLIALSTLLDHSRKEIILKQSQIQFYFFEINEKYCQSLNTEIQNLAKLPKNVQIIGPICSNYEGELTRILNELDKLNQILHPTFAFLDPFSCDISMELINRILRQPHCEVMINVMFRQIDMMLNNISLHSKLNKLFGSNVWKKCLGIEDKVKRIECISNTYLSQLCADYIQEPVQMWGKNYLKYFLFHATNNLTGWDKMKEAIWSIIPDGSFKAFVGDRPEQKIISKPEPDFSDLENLILNLLTKKSYRFSELLEWRIKNRLKYLEKHIRDCLKNLNSKKNLIEFDNWKKPFGLNVESDPLICKNLKLF